MGEKWGFGIPINAKAMKAECERGEVGQKWGEMRGKWGVGGEKMGGKWGVGGTEIGVWDPHQRRHHEGRV